MKLKPFTVSDIAIKKAKLFPLFRRSESLNKNKNKNIEERWSASSEKVSSLTVRIMAVNIIAIMILGVGILYLGQYTDSLIEGELETMRAEAQLFSGALSEGSVRPVFQISPIPFEDPLEIQAIKPDLARKMIGRLGSLGESRIQLFGVDGDMLADSNILSGVGGTGSVVEMEELRTPIPTQDINSLFAQSATRFLDLIPMQTQLERLPQDTIKDIFSFPDTKEAMFGRISTHAWEYNDGIVLTAAAPIQKVKQVLGVVLLIRDGKALEDKIASIRVDVFRVFLGALGITVMLSIYLSGIIGKPLQRLALAAEAVRLGKGNHEDIPDMSRRGDEIGELSLVIRDMTRALHDRMDTIERFAADVSHEIKNPLTSLRSAVETASRVKDEEKRKKLMDVIHHDVQRLDRLITDISSASRLDAELSRDEMVTVDLKKLLQRLQDAYKKPLNRIGDDNDQEDSVILLNDDGSQDFFVAGNEERLAQVFGNLITNALSFSPKGKPVTLSLSRSDGFVLATVSDHGPGIPNSKIETIFDRFYTERPDHEDYGSHSGLGLSISKQIIEAHRGYIWADNILDGQDNKIGAQFSVKLKEV
ncbi:MAG: stimulus-sensing domain-containing protein [Pseudomonadota bacterium]